MQTFPYGYSNTEVTFEYLRGRNTWTRLHPEFRRRVSALMHAAADAGVPLGIGTGWRSYETQKAGYLRDPAGFARPGNSNHEGFPGDGNGDRDAVAADMVPASSWAWMDQHAADYGLRTFKLVNREPWHIQPVEIPASRTGRNVRWPLAEWPLADVETSESQKPEPVVAEPVVEPPPAAPAPPVVLVGPNVQRVVMQIIKTVLRLVDREALRGSNDVALCQIVCRLVTPDLVVDSDFGPATAEAATRYQQFSGLTADGIWGPKTWACVLNADGT